VLSIRLNAVLLWILVTSRERVGRLALPARDPTYSPLIGALEASGSLLDKVPQRPDPVSAEGALNICTDCIVRSLTIT
jgi:hypothetical protein